MKHAMLAVLMAASLALVSMTATAAPAAAPAAAASSKPATRLARVAGGGKVTLVNPRLTPAQLSALRPGFRDLRPRARGNVE